MAISIRGGAPGVGSNNGSSATVAASSPDSSPAIGDVAVVFHGNDFYALSNMPAPTTTGAAVLTAISGGTADGGTNLAHIKSYTYIVNTAGTQTVTVTETGSADEDKWIVIYVLAGANNITPVDGTAGNATGNSSSQAAAAVSPTNTNSYAIIANGSGGGASAASYTSPGDVTEQYEIHTGGVSGVGATKQLSASGSTGTFTFTASGSIPWGAVTVAIATASGASVDGTVTLTETETTTSAASVDHNAAVSLTETETITAAAAVDHNATVSLTETETVTSAAAVDHNATVAVTETETITSAAAVDHNATVSLTETETTTVTAAVDHGADASLTETETTTSAAAVDRNAVAALTETAAIVSTAAVTRSADVALITTATVTAAAGIDASVSLTIAADVTADAVVTSPLTGDLVQPLAQALLDCLCATVALAPNPPAHCCFRVGNEVAHDADLFGDLCCEGLGYVTLGDIYPSTDSFPEQDIIRQAISRCGIASWAVSLKVGIVRCAPVGGPNGEMPSCIDWNTAATQNFSDAQVLRSVACCFINQITTMPIMNGMSVVVNRQIQSTPQGGCVERYLTIDVQIPNCDC